METSNIIGEIHKLIDEKINSGIVVNVDWITHAILQGKMSIEGEDAPFYRVCGYEAARQMRRRGSIAPEHWSRVVSASQAREIEGISFEWLAAQRSEVAA